MSPDHTASPVLSSAPVVLVLAETADLSGPVCEQAAAAGVGVRLDGTGPGAALVLADEARLADAVALRRGGRGGAAPLHVLCRAPVPDVAYRRALDAGAVSVVAVPDDLPRLGGLLADLDRPRQARVVALTGGSGGVGVTVLATAVALRSVTPERLGRGSAPATLLVDLDPEGPGLGRLVEGAPGPGVTWVDLHGLSGRLAASELRSSVPTVAGVGLLTWPDERSVDAGGVPVAEVMSAAARGHDWVVVDAPRVSGGELERLGLDLVVLVVDASVTGVASAARRLSWLRRTGHPVAVVVRTRRGSAPAADVARVLDLRLLAELRDDRRLREQLDLGLGPLRGRRCPLDRAADAVLAAAAAPSGEGQR